MFELTISVSYNKSSIIEQLVKQIENDVKLSGGIIVCGLFDGRTQASLAVKECKKDFIKAKVLNILSDAIVTHYKFEYLSENINHGLIKEKDREALLRALSEFDKSTDIDLVKKNLVFTNNIVVDSVYYFKLGELKNRWNDIVELVNTNLPNLIATGSLIDMMKFLIASSPYKTDEIYILIKNEFIYVLDNLNNSQLNLKFKRKDLDIEQKLINYLIKVSPRRIYISNDVYKGLDFMGKIENLFDGRVFITH